MKFRYTKEVGVKYQWKLNVFRGWSLMSSCTASRPQPILLGGFLVKNTQFIIPMSLWHLMLWLDFMPIVAGGTKRGWTTSFLPQLCWLSARPNLPSLYKPMNLPRSIASTNQHLTILHLTCLLTKSMSCWWLADPPFSQVQRNPHVG